MTCWPRPRRSWPPTWVMRSPPAGGPGSAPAARQLGAGAVFAFPLIVGAIRAGVLGLYRGAPGPLPDRQLGDLLILADAATVMLLGSAHGDAGDGDGAAVNGQAPDLALHRAEIDQATGMLTVQLGSRPRRRSPGCGPTLMPRTGGWPTWPATSSPGACGCTATRIRDGGP